jgi:hypothetical protein
MVEQVTEEVVGWEPEPTLEEGFQNNNFIVVGHRDALILTRPPLENDAGSKKVVIEQLEDLALIDGGGPKHLRVSSGHRGGLRILARLEHEEEEGRKKKWRQWWWCELGLRNVL